MSGHSKWANIKRQKMANDMVRGNAFAKLSKLVTLAVIEGGGITDPDHNVKLRLAIDKAKQSNMPKENIKRAIDRGTGPDKSLIREVVYEGFAPGGVSLMILTTTDNPNRTLTEVRNIVEKNHGKLGASGAVSYLFKKCGLIIFKKDSVKEEDAFMIGDKLGAFDIDSDETRFYVYFPFENLGHIKDNINDVKYESAEIDFKPQSLVTISDADLLTKIESLVNILEEQDDVHRVFTNLEFSQA